jgi:KaiC/GvpD/RAD55 family RecA-like ATPase
LQAVGRTINDLLEYNQYHRYFLLSNRQESEKNLVECLSLAKKAIKIFSKLSDNYELARSYCFASWWHTWSPWFFESTEKVVELNQKCENYANRAVKLSLKTKDAWLIGWSYVVAFNAAQLCNWNPTLGKEYGEKTLEYGTIAKDNFLIGFGNVFINISTTHLASLLEDPEKQKEGFKKAIKSGQQAITHFLIINEIPGICTCSAFIIDSFANLAAIETDPTARIQTLENANKVIEEGLEVGRGWKKSSGGLFRSLSYQLLALSKTKRNVEEKRKFLFKALSYAKKYFVFVEETYPFSYLMLRLGYYQLALTQDELAKIETSNIKKIKLLKSAAKAMEKAIKVVEKKRKLVQSKWTIGLVGQYYDKLGAILQQTYSLKKEENTFIKTIKAYQNATLAFKKAELPTHIAESYWHIAQLQDQLSQHQEASQNYELASKSYDQASKKIPQLKEFYKNYSNYMNAWSQIEQAGYNHSIEEYDKAKEHYEKAAKLHESTDQWKYLTPNYSAWASIEKAESLSRKEKTIEAKKAFQKAYHQFIKAKESIKQKIEEIESQDEKQMTIGLLKASDLRSKYCQARILLEEAKLLDKKGKYLQSSKNYGEAAKEIETIQKKLETETEQKELKLITILCKAWEKMALAEGKTSSEIFIKAAELFENAKNLSHTKKTSLWALGNSSFCKGLAAQHKFQNTLDRSFHSKANKYVKQAANYYKQAGFQVASEYAKATQRLFDAYLYMNSAEDEVDPGKKTKYYQLSENLLQIAAGSFMKSKQPEKATEVKRILTTVREEKALAISLNEVMQAPSIATSTLSFATPNPTSEVSVGLEQFEGANIQTNLIADISEIRVGESFCLSVEFVNAGKEPALLTRVEEFVPKDFVVVKKPEIYRLEETALNMKGKQIAPLKLVEAKVVLQPLRKGVYHLNPRVHYLDERGQNKTLQLKSIEIKVQEVVLANRMSTGTKELDSLLLGGIPNEYAVVLTGPPSDEREFLIKNFLEAGIKQEQSTFCVASEAAGLENLFEKSGFFLFLCNPKPKVAVPDLPNVTKLKGKTNLTNLNIALYKVYRNIRSTKKRICNAIVSDVLLDYGAKTTRKWIAEMITELSSKGFTMLAVLDLGMHPADQANAITYLFDGEISITQTDDQMECKKHIQIKKLRGQDYIKNPICITKQA